MAGPVSPYPDTPLPSRTHTPFIGQTRAYGLELEGTWQPAPLFELSGNLVLQKPTFQNLAPLGAGPPVAGVNGNQVERIPQVVGSMTPLLNLDLLQHPTRLYLTVYHQGDATSTQPTPPHSPPTPPWTQA